MSPPLLFISVLVLLPLATAASNTTFTAALAEEEADDHNATATALIRAELDEITALNRQRLASASSLCTGGNTCCSASTPCAFGEGDCDSNEDCLGAQVCGIGNCNDLLEDGSGYRLRGSRGKWGLGDDCCTVREELLQVLRAED